MDKIEAIAEEFIDENAGDTPDTLQLDTVPLEDIHRENGGVVGAVHKCPTYDCLAYYSVRNERDHFYWKGKAYPIDDTIVERLTELGVEKVFIGQTDKQSVLEFDFQQYRECQDGETIHHPPYAKQRYTPRENAVRKWPNHTGTLFVD